MCLVSNVGDLYTDRWNQPHYVTTINYPLYASKEDLDSLREEVLEMKGLLKKALKQDIEEGNPNCEMEDKVAMLKQVADIVGVDLSKLI